MKVRVHEGHVRYAVGNDINFVGRGVKDFLEYLASALGHDDHASGAGEQFLHDAALVGVGLAQEGVQGGDDGHFERAHQAQHVAAGRSAEDAKLVLEGNPADVGDVDEIRRALIGGKFLLLDLEPHALGIFVAALHVVHRHHEALRLGMLRSDGFAQIAGERRDATLAGQIITHKRQFFNF